MIKYILLPLLLAAAYFNGSAQTWQSTCDSTIVSERIFRNDVSRLALDRLFKLNNTYKDSVEIPQIFKDSIAKGLYAIYNMVPSSLKDTIITAFCENMFDTTNYQYYWSDSVHIHHSGKGPGYAPSIKKLDVYIGNNGNNLWADLDWASGNYYNTRDTQVNQFLGRYGLRVKKTSNFLPHYLLTCSRAINTTELAKRFLALLVGGTITNSSDPLAYVGDGNTIDFQYSPDGIIITFRNGCGDCPSGCTYGRYWTFQVNTFTDCSVTYMKDSTFFIGAPPQNNIYTCLGNILPLFFKSFNAEEKENKAKLYWDVATDNSVNYYSIEKSFNQVNFIEAGRVYAVPSNNLNKSYQWQDYEQHISNTFYRIKAVDKNAKIIYSNIVLLKAKMQQTTVTISPNPVVGKQLTVYYSNAAIGNYTLQLYTTEGKLVCIHKMAINKNSSNYSFTLPASISTKGTYLVKIKSANEENVLQQLVVIE